MSRERGAAAVELAIVIGLLVSLVSLVAPLSLLFYENLQLGRTAGDVVRFASSRTDGERQVPGASPVAPGALPGPAQVAAEARAAYTGRSTVVSDPLVHRDGDDTSGCPSRNRITVTLRTTVDVGPFLGVFTDNTRTLTARASSCEE